jgi:hypothetical protein
MNRFSWIKTMTSSAAPPAPLAAPAPTPRSANGALKPAGREGKKAVSGYFPPEVSF